MIAQIECPLCKRMVPVKVETYQVLIYEERMSVIFKPQLVTHKCPKPFKLTESLLNRFGGRLRIITQSNVPRDPKALPNRSKAATRSSSGAQSHRPILGGKHGHRWHA